jgi:hypothetical protein
MREAFWEVKAELMIVYVSIVPWNKKERVQGDLHSLAAGEQCSKSPICDRPGLCTNLFSVLIYDGSVSDYTIITLTGVHKGGDPFTGDWIKAFVSFPTLSIWLIPSLEKLIGNMLI